MKDPWVEVMEGVRLCTRAAKGWARQHKISARYSRTQGQTPSRKGYKPIPRTVPITPDFNIEELYGSLERYPAGGGRYIPAKEDFFTRSFQ